MQLGCQNKSALEKWIATDIRRQMGLRRDFYNQDMTLKTEEKTERVKTDSSMNFPIKIQYLALSNGNKVNCFQRRLTIKSGSKGTLC